jgi:KDO2-lipid IV(A) lauroyltransferase
MSEAVKGEPAAKPALTRADRIDWALHLAMTAMPAPLCSALGARLSPIMGRKANPAAHLHARAALAALRPEWGRDPAALDAAMDRLWESAGRTFAEYAVSLRMLRAGRATIAGEADLDAALNAGRPIIALFVHTGNFEMSEMQIAFRAPNRVVVIYDPPKRAARAAIALKIRRQVPCELLPMSRLVWRHTLERLRDPRCIFMTAADEAVDGHIGAPFFGRPPRLDGNLGKVARLAMRTGALVLPFFDERHPGPRFTTHVLPPFDFKGSPNDEAAVRAAVVAMDAAFTPHVLRLIDQWFSALLYNSAAPDGWG